MADILNLPDYSDIKLNILGTQEEDNHTKIELYYNKKASLIEPLRNRANRLRELVENDKISERTRAWYNSQIYKYERQIKDMIG